mgnify:CR=1 FL=1
MGILLAIVAAVGWGLSSNFARLGFNSNKSLSPAGGVFVSVISSLGVVLAINLIFQWEQLASISIEAILWFSLIGLTGFAFARYCHFKGVELIGASRASSLSAAAPLFAVLVAVVFLHENLTWPILTGILLIIGGLYSLSGQEDKARSPGTVSQTALKRANLWGYIFSLLSALGWGGTSSLIRWGVSNLAPPLVGALVAVTMGTIVLSWPGIRNLKSSQVSKGAGLVFFLLAGLMSALGTIANYGALKLLPVVVASPLANTSPLFTLLFAFAFMRGTEKIDWKIILGSVVIIGGSAIITLAR